MKLQLNNIHTSREESKEETTSYKVFFSTNLLSSQLASVLANVEKGVIEVEFKDKTSGEKI